MVSKIFLVASAATALVIAGPAFAQSSSGTTGASGNHDGPTTSSTTDTNVQASVPINSNNSGSENNSSTHSATVASGNTVASDNSDSSTHSNTNTNTNTNNSTHTANLAFDSGNTSTHTNNLDSNNTNNSTHTATVASNNSNSSTHTNTNTDSSTHSTDLAFNSNNTSTHTNTLDSNNTDNSTHSNSLAFDSNNTDNSQRNGNWRVVAVQDLSSTAAPVSLNGRHDTNTLTTGENSIAGSSFAAYAGIMNQSWNSGVSSSAQAATNIASQGTITF